MAKVILTAAARVDLREIQHYIAAALMKIPMGYPWVFVIQKSAFRETGFAFASRRYFRIK